MGQPTKSSPKLVNLVVTATKLGATKVVLFWFILKYVPSLSLAFEMPSLWPWCLKSSGGLYHYSFKFLIRLLNREAFSWSATSLLHRSDYGNLYFSDFTTPRSHLDNIKSIIKYLTYHEKYVYTID